MDFYELLEYLDLESADQFEYFECMADLAECDEYIEQEAVYALFEGADKTMIPELFEDYFEDILEGLPEDAGEIYSLLHQIKMSLIGLAQNRSDMPENSETAGDVTEGRNGFNLAAGGSWLSDEDGGDPLQGAGLDEEARSDLRRLVDEFCRFRNWYVEESDVELMPEKGGAPIHQCLRDAITTARMQRLGGDVYRYDFEGSLDYELDSYTMSFGELAAAEDGYNDGAIVFDPSEEPADDEESETEALLRDPMMGTIIDIGSGRKH